MTPAGLARLKADEGCNLMPYSDIRGRLSIGYGRNLTDQGISVDEASMMLVNDIDRCQGAVDSYDWFVGLDDVRRDVLVMVAFNCGVAGLLGFHRMLAALAAGDFETATAELLDSDAARLLPARYARMADALRTGAWK